MSEIVTWRSIPSGPMLKVRVGGFFFLYYFYFVLATFWRCMTPERISSIELFHRYMLYFLRFSSPFVHSLFFFFSFFFCFLNHREPSSVQQARFIARKKLGPCAPRLVINHVAEVHIPSLDVRSGTK